MSDDGKSATIRAGRTFNDPFDKQGDVTMVAKKADAAAKEDTKPAAKKAAPKKAAATKVAAAPEGKRTDGIHKPVQPSAELAEIVGSDMLARGEVVSKMWVYIKANDLQDPKDKRQINADAKLEKIFGKKSVSMFEMNKHLSAHLK
ncbi:SWIB/MDM2 domain-containing protein [Sphingomonas arantia]